MRVQISVGIDSSLLREVDDTAHAESRSRGNMVGQLVKEALEHRAELAKIIERKTA